MAHLSVTVPFIRACLSKAARHLACHAPPTPGDACQPRRWLKPTALPFHRVPHAGRHPVCWLYPLVPLELEKSSFASSLALTPFHISPLLCAQLLHHRAAGPSDPKEAPHTPKGLRQLVLHSRAKPLCRVKGLKLPDGIRSSAMMASCGQLLPNQSPVRPAPHRALPECHEAL
jgi:hypothetical protein